MTPSHQEDASMQHHNKQWKKKGNEVAMKKIIDMLYCKILQDGTLSPYFQGSNMLTLKGQQEKLMALVFGGIELVQDEFPEFDLRAIHMRLLVEGRLSQQHWESFVQHFKETLAELEDIPDETRERAVAWLLTTRAAFSPPEQHEVEAFNARRAAGGAPAGCPMHLG